MNGRLVVSGSRRARANSLGLGAAIVGCAVALVIASTIILVVGLLVGNQSAIWKAAVGTLVTVTIAGGAAGLTVTNIKYRRTEEYRLSQIAADERLRSATQVIDSEGEIQQIAGIEQARSIIALDRQNADVAAGLLCSRLRPREGWQPDEPSNRRVLLAAVKAIEHSASVSGDYNRSAVNWDFDELYFPRTVTFVGCVFGPDTSMENVVVNGDLRFIRCTFLGDLRIVNPVVRGIIDIVGCIAGGIIMDGGKAGTHMRSSSASFIQIRRTRTSTISLRRMSLSSTLDVEDVYLTGHLEVESIRAESIKLANFRSTDFRMVGCHAEYDIRIEDATIRDGKYLEYSSAGRHLMISPDIDQFQCTAKHTHIMG